METKQILIKNSGSYPSCFEIQGSMLLGSNEPIKAGKQAVVTLVETKGKSYYTIVTKI